ncbi:MAG: PhzF family phenazine biosynthesis protein [Pseudoxanthomonas sp.]
MQIERLAAFCHGASGGNPAGVVVTDVLPSAADMQAIAARVGYSETAFAAPEGAHWRVRYFSPELEVPFCGHATIALGAALTARQGNGEFVLQLNRACIRVEGWREGDIVSASLQSPPTKSGAAPVALRDQALALFGYAAGALDPRLPPALAHAGADHLILALGKRQALAALRYDLNAGRDFMRTHSLTTIALVVAEHPQRFHARNPFASGGVYEDPATGAAAAALSGYLRDANWPHGGHIEILQGEDMGSPSRLLCDIPAEPGSSIRVSGTARWLPG